MIGEGRRGGRDRGDDDGGMLQEEVVGGRVDQAPCRGDPQTVPSGRRVGRHAQGDVARVGNVTVDEQADGLMVEMVEMGRRT